MAFVIDISQTILQKMYFEAGLQKIFACVAHAVFRSDSAYIYVGRVKKLQHFSERLFGIVDALESRILLESLVTSFVECQLLFCIRLERAVYFAAMGAGYAVSRPDASIFLE